MGNYYSNSAPQFKKIDPEQVLKQHPCLVPYEELPEEEKAYDRDTALGTLKLITKLGFRISKKS